MQKQLFITQIKQNLTALLPFSAKEITINSGYFTQSIGSVAFFIAEIEKTAEELLAQEDVTYSEFYADKLVKQFDLLNKAVATLTITKKPQQFHSSYQFSPHIHRLPPKKRLHEYHRALRALNEKISWLVEQNYSEKNEHYRQSIQDQIAETEYRKSKCLIAIEDLEQELQFRKGD